MTDAGTEGAQGSPFWRFSLGFYRQPGVADACIALQDENGVDVNVLMFFLWFATQQKEITSDQARAVWEQAALWRDHVVAPLRSVRRKLKEGLPLVPRDIAEFFRTRIKAAELESERLEQEALFAMIPSIEAGSAPSVETAARANVLAYEQALAVAFAPGPLEILLAALASFARRDAGTT
jgi:uncharacterized protein (TIGR02444 family)